MNDTPQNGSTDPSQSPGLLASAARRREVLRTLGRATAAAGAASPLAAMAGGNGRPWCYKDKTFTTCTPASISAAGSLIQSVAPGSTPHGGKPCGHYGTSTNVPASCSSSLYKQLFTCSGNDTNGKPITDPACLYNRTISDICTAYPTSAEAHWAGAYCNAVVGWRSDPKLATFPYSPAQVSGFFSDTTKKAAAYSFFTTYMENG